MKFSVSSSELLNGLMSVSKVIVPKPTNSILENFLFQLEGNTLTVTASDGETTLKTTIAIAQVSQEGATAVPAKLLTDSLKEFPDQPLSFSVDPGSSVMDIVWASGASKIPCFDAADFPELPEINEISESVIIPSAVLLDGINNTIYATAEEELRPVMNGIFFDIDPEVTTLVASDAPVAHHKSVKTPFITKDVGQQELVFGRVHIVYPVVRAHYGVRFCVLHCALKCSGVYFKESSLVHICRAGHSPCFLIVAGKVFERRSYTHALNAFNVRSCYL